MRVRSQLIILWNCICFTSFRTTGSHSSLLRFLVRDPKRFLQDLGFNLFQGWVSGFWRKRKAGSRKWNTNWVPDLVMSWCWLQDILFIHVGRNLVSKVNWGFSNVRKNSWRQLTRYINYYNYPHFLDPVTYKIVTIFLSGYLPWVS